MSDTAQGDRLKVVVTSEAFLDSGARVVHVSEPIQLAPGRQEIAFTMTVEAAELAQGETITFHNPTVSVRAWRPES